MGTPSYQLGASSDLGTIYAWGPSGERTSRQPIGTWETTKAKDAMMVAMKDAERVGTEATVDLRYNVVGDSST